MEAKPSREPRKSAKGKASSKNASEPLNDCHSTRPTDAVAASKDRDQKLLALVAKRSGLSEDKIMTLALRYFLVRGFEYEVQGGRFYVIPTLPDQAALESEVAWIGFLAFGNRLGGQPHQG
jgi:hypothetical protein